MNTNIILTDKPIDILKGINWVMSPESGGINVFIGTVRSTTKGNEVQRLEFESYESMAVSEMHKIANDCFSKWNLHKILIHHRTGVLEIGNVPVLIAVSAAHRKEAFEACRYIIDTLKETVPIWKKEIFMDGEEWVAAHP